MKQSLLFLCLTIAFQHLFAQQPVTRSSSEIMQDLKKLQTLGSVLFIAAHPDDENTRLLAWLANEKKYRTGYLSLTRGDGGQNLIGDEQGVELGLIRTQELIAARRIDGAEQFFTRAYDFGFSKNPEETFRIWDKQKILADVVFVIRKFQPDVLISRFPTTGEGGHGHHTASAILAEEAFDLAGDPKAFPEQLKYVSVWKPKRLMWNTFSFGTVNTIREDQFKLEVGAYNPLIGKSYGEIAADSRSQHKSQGFGVARNRGESYEYFRLLKGDMPVKDLLDGVNITWNRLEGGAAVQSKINDIINTFSVTAPEKSVKKLAELYQTVSKLKKSNWQTQKLKEIASIITYCTGLWVEAVAGSENAVQGDSMRLTFTVNPRLPANVKLLSVSTTGFDTTLNATLPSNRNFIINKSVFIRQDHPITQPYWLESKMNSGYFNVQDQHLIGDADSRPAFEVDFEVEIEGVKLNLKKPVLYKYTDPVKGEIYQPVVVVPPVNLKVSPSILLFKQGESITQTITVTARANKDISKATAEISASIGGTSLEKMQRELSLQKGSVINVPFSISSEMLKGNNTQLFIPEIKLSNGIATKGSSLGMRTISYDHIPELNYFYENNIKVLNIDLKTSGKRVGYIVGAGDKVPQALEQMGYEVIILNQNDIVPSVLSTLDAVITGVRAYNVHEYLSDKYEVLMEYVKNGGNLIVQYNTNTQIGPVKAKIGPYDFTISRTRVTDENAPVQFLDPDHPVLNYPNKITQKDFEGWIQERGIYFAAQRAPEFKSVLSMNDPGESPSDGSLIIANYGKGTFVYTGLVFFRELPAGVPGAYRLMANLIALNQNKP